MKPLVDYIEYQKWLAKKTREIEEKISKSLGYGVKFDKVPEGIIEGKKWLK